MTELAGVTNGGEAVIDLSQPYRVSFELTGTSDMLMHRWNNEAVDEKAKAAKNSKAKKSDDIESYVYRNDDGMVCLPGEYVRQAIIFAAKFRQDPRSPRKSAMDLYKAGVVSLTDLASLGRDTWDYEDRRRVVVQRAGINRTRPAFKKGWRAEFDFMVLTPEYIEPTDLHAVLTQAGILIGVADFRPTYGRFGVTKYQVITD
ncbi:hypothetical protein GTC054_53860 [Burkholderia pseudomallei]|nr:hypothetical protein GTC054_53860 [Burkholderia pseudomallei]